MIKQNLTRTAGAPKGFWGFWMIQKMNHFHTKLSQWGLGFFVVEHQAKLLEIGCGGGRNLKRLSRMAPNGIVYGIDVAPLSVRRSRLHNLFRVMKGKVRVREGNVAKLPFARERLDGVVAFETVYYWPNIVASFKEVHRVLRPGGQFLICNEDHADPENPHEHDALKSLVKVEMNVYTNEALEDALKEAGFQQVEIYEHENGEWVTFLATA